ncbi:MAG: hypothetical protein WEA04_04990 [Candidatus Andersenbacteria bacterium]
MRTTNFYHGDFTIELQPGVSLLQIPQHVTLIDRKIVVKNGTWERVHGGIYFLCGSTPFTLLTAQIFSIRDSTGEILYESAVAKV